MCKNWEKNGSCPYNNKCRFAHGKKEIMNKEAESNPNYKAKDCLNFFKFGFCNYGRRCCFKHDERKIDEENLESDFKLLFSLTGNSKRLSAFSSITDTRYKNMYKSTMTLNSKESKEIFDYSKILSELNLTGSEYFEKKIHELV